MMAQDLNFMDFYNSEFTYSNSLITWKIWAQRGEVT